MTCEFHARLIGKREINLIARLNLLQIFLINVQIALYSLVVLNLHERRLHIGKAAQTGCNLRNRTRYRSMQREAVVNLPLATAAVEMPIWASCLPMPMRLAWAT